MLPQSERVLSYAPLRDIDIGGVDFTNAQPFENDHVAPSWNLRSQCFYRPVCWTVCSATALYTTKCLMVNHGYHYPFTIAFRVLATILVAYIMALRLDGESANRDGNPRKWGLRRPDGDDFLMNRCWAAMLPASLVAATAFPMFLQGVLHMPSLPALVMLFPVIYAAESLVLFVCCSPSRSRKCLPWEAVLAALSCSAVLYNEYRLMVPGLVWGVTSILLMGLSRACFIIASERSGSDLEVQSRLKAYHGFTIMSLTFGTIVCGTFALQFENTESIYPISRGTVAISVINILSFVGSAFSGTWILAYSPISFEEGKEHFSNIPICPANFLASSAASLLVVLGVIFWDRPSLVSWIQILACLIGATSLLGMEQIHNVVPQCMENTQQRLNRSFQKETKEPRKPARFVTAGALLIFLTFISWSLSSLATASIYYLKKSPPSNLDVSYKAESRFDIVVSMYEEDPKSIREMLDEIKATTPLQSLQPRVIIYTKNQNQNLYYLKLSTGADIAERLENLGREGGTYLWHIVNKWDELAEQTMFIQAHAHNMRELIPRIESYLVPKTGMLSLGFTGMTCACDSCGDRFGWEDKWGVVPTLYERIYLATMHIFHTAHPSFLQRPICRQRAAHSWH